MRDLSLEFRKNNTYYDKKGKQILEGDLLKVFHFRGARGKIHYMYHVAVMEDKDICPNEPYRFPVMGGRAYDADKPHYRFYLMANEKRVLETAEIVSEKDWQTKRIRIKI